MENKPNKNKNSLSIINIKLSTADRKQLQRYCFVNKLGEKTAVKKIIRTYLDENLPKLDEEAENQLELFRPFQRNIFDR
ncbi:MAG: hypothetical protein LBR28_02705 [Bacteroidales bacterium]|jgi:hypothetical protein|nr:hypothetical protein [Bacteroidales bacterium]